MGFGVVGRLLLFVLLLSMLLFSGYASAARTTTFTSDEETWTEEGRSLKVKVNDYGVPMANPGHDPPSTSGSGKKATRSSSRARRG